MNNYIKKTIAFVFICLCFIGLIGCDPDHTPVTTDYYMNIEIDSYSIYVDEYLEIELDTNIITGITWESYDESIATVADGVVCGVSKGDTFISAIYDELLVEIYIEVKNAPVQQKQYQVTIDGEVVTVREGVALIIVLKDLFYGKDHYNYNNTIFEGWFLDSSYTTACDLMTKVYSNMILYAKYTTDNNDCMKIAINNTIDYNGDFIDAPIAQVFSPNYNKTTEYKDFKYENHFMASVEYNLSTSKYQVTDTFVDGYKNNIIIPYNGFVISISKDIDNYTNYIEQLTIGSVITLDRYSINSSGKLYINKAKNTFTNTFTFKGSVSASYMCAYDVTNEIFLYEKDSDSKAYPASVTKIVTAIAALKYASLDDVYTIGDELDAMNEGSSPSTAGLVKGEKWSLRHLMYAMLLPSGNDAAYSIAAGVALNLPGNENLTAREALDVFAELMNEIFTDLNLTNSHFMVPDGNSYYVSGGAWDDRLTLHYTTAKDMMYVSNLAFKCGAIAGITSTASMNFKIQSGQSKGYNNTNSLIKATNEYYYPYAVGLKTGTTTPAGNCLISGAECDGRFVIIVTLKSSTSAGRYSDTLLVYRAIFGK